MILVGPGTYKGGGREAVIPLTGEDAEVLRDAVAELVKQRDYPLAGARRCWSCGAYLGGRGRAVPSHCPLCGYQQPKASG